MTQQPASPGRRESFSTTVAGLCWLAVLGMVAWAAVASLLK